MTGLRERLVREALPFLACMERCAPEDAWLRPQHWQTFDEDKTRKDGSLAKHWPQDLDGAAAELERLNQAGAGIFLTVNRTDGRGRTKAHIQALRGWHADLDTKDASEPFDLARVPLPPTMAVQTPGGWHLYWLPHEPMPCPEEARRLEHEAELRGLQAALSIFGADRAACEVARVLRLPGFEHRKDQPLPVRLVLVDGPRYSREEIREAFPPQEKAQRARKEPQAQEPKAQPSSTRRTAPDPDQVRRYLDTLEPSIQGQDGSHALFTAALKITDGYDLTNGQAVDFLERFYNPRCQPVWSTAEIQRAVDRAAPLCQDRGHLLREAPRLSPGSPSSGDDQTSPKSEDRPAVKGFEWGARGLFQLKPGGKDGDGNENPPQRVWIAPPFTLPGLVRDEASRGWRMLIAWQDFDGTPHEEALPFELVNGEGAELGRLLAQGGMMLPPDPGLRRQLLRYLCGAASKVKARVRLVDALGWQEGAFILPGGETIGQSGEPVRYAGDSQGLHMSSVRGTLEGWQAGVARYAVGNPRLAFALACAFAGPILGLVRPDGGGGFNLMGASSRGKSTCLEAAASVWGRPDLPTWRATGNGLEGIAGTRNDGFLPLDELSQVDPKEAGAVAYMLANGSAKARMSKDGGNRQMKQWRLVFLSTGEQGLEDKISEDGNGKKARAGQEVRVPDIPCPPEGMFEHPHDLPSLGALAEHLKAQARKHHGHAARTFLRGICEEWERREALQAKLQEMERAWLASILPPGADAQVRRVAGRFALVAVAGELAQRMGILPWPEGEASRASEVCFKAWLDRRGFSGASEVHRGIEAVLDFIEKHGQARFDDWGTDSKIINRAGTRKRAEGPVDGWDFFISSSAWKEVCTGFSSRDVARSCADAGILEPGEDGKKARSVTIPGHGKVRCYVIRAVAVANYRQGEDVA